MLFSYGFTMANSGKRTHKVSANRLEHDYYIYWVVVPYKFFLPSCFNFRPFGQLGNKEIKAVMRHEEENMKSSSVSNMKADSCHNFKCLCEMFEYNFKDKTSLEKHEVGFH